MPPSSRVVDNFIIGLTNRLEKMLEEDKKGIHSKPNNLLDMELRALKILKNKLAAQRTVDQQFTIGEFPNLVSPKYCYRPGLYRTVLYTVRVRISESFLS